MPLLKIFSRRPLGVPASVLHQRLVAIWNVESTPQVLKVLSLPVVDESTQGEDVYVDIRAKAKPERTPQVVEEACRRTASLLGEHGHKAVVRLELYEPSLQFLVSHEE
mmetsp:Transcript_11078/g.25174  ORF Transcript_11078/g.25174 Transcript_11078/m.25174 type:complete len:108 (-) Transcript_11078:259-582(-)